LAQTIQSANENSKKMPVAWENVWKQVTIGFGFTHGQMTKCCKFFKPIVLHKNEKPMIITFGHLSEKCCRIVHVVSVLLNECDDIPSTVSKFVSALSIVSCSVVVEVFF